MTGKQIFRPIAVQRYLKSRQEPQFPALVRPRGFVLLWVFLALTIAGLVLIGLAEIPRTATGVAFLLDSEPGGADRQVIVLLPPDRLHELAPGQTVLLEASEQSSFLARIVDVEPAVLSPKELRRRWSDLARAGGARTPACVALGRCEGTCGEEEMAGALLRARVVVGQAPLIQRLGNGGAKEQR